MQPTHRPPADRIPCAPGLRWKQRRHAERMIPVRFPGSLLCASLAAAAVTAVAASGQQDQPIREKKPFKSGVELVSLTATVLDTEGHFVKGLPREAFEVYEDGKPQPITQFSNERVPVSVGVLLDISDSMYGQRIHDARTALSHFLFDLLSSADEYFLLTFNHEPHVLTEWTSEREIVDKALE